MKNLTDWENNGSIHLAGQVEQEQTELSYHNNLVALDGNQVVGIANFFPAERHRITAQMEGFFPKERLDALREFYSSLVDSSLLLNALSVAVEYRGQGIGSQLIAYTKQRAQEDNFAGVSLIVWADNGNAIQLYQREGFKEIQRIHLAPHPLMPHPDGCILMYWSLQ